MNNQATPTRNRHTLRREDRDISTQSIQSTSQHADQSTCSINPRDFVPQHRSSPHAHVTFDEDCSVFGTDAPNISMAPRAPRPAGDVALPRDTPSPHAEQHSTQKRLPATPDEPSPPDSSQLLHPNAPLFRPDPATDHAVTAARDCRESVINMLQVSPYAPLRLYYTQPDKSPGPHALRTTTASLAVRGQLLRAATNVQHAGQLTLVTSA